MKKTTDELHNYVVTEDSITFSSIKGARLAGIYIPIEKLESNQAYSFEYDITVIEGIIASIGGHHEPNYVTNYYLEGKEPPENYYAGTPFSPTLNTKHTIKVTFKRVSDSVGKDDRIYIQPNRVPRDSGMVEYNTNYRVKINNIKLYKIRG